MGREALFGDLICDGLFYMQLNLLTSSMLGGLINDRLRWLLSWCSFAGAGKFEIVNVVMNYVKPFCV